MWYNMLGSQAEKKLQGCPKSESWFWRSASRYVRHVTLDKANCQCDNNAVYGEFQKWRH